MSAQGSVHAPPAGGGRPGRGVQAVVLVGLLALCLAVDYLSATVTRPAIETWYQTLERPAWTPPDLAFPIVWLILYLAMAVAAWLAWRAAPRIAAGALVPFAIQLAINAAWPVVFFGWQRPDLAFAVVLALLLAILGTTAAFAQRSRAAAWLMVPYALWVAYATTLNAGVVWLNG